MPYRTTNPYNNKVIAQFADLTDAELEQLVSQAGQAFESWRDRTFSDRSTVLKRAGQILRDRSDEFARLLTLEMGKLLSESRGEVAVAAAICDYYAENAAKFLAPQSVPTNGATAGEATVVHEPLGVLLGVQPWNFPYYQLARFAAPNLMAGNVVIVKHASIVPQSAAAFERLLRDAGAPDGVYTNVYATKDQVTRLIRDPRIRGVALTGSEAAGAVVAAEAGKQLKKTTMELGGSDALIVLDDADLDKAVEWAVWGRMNNGGQSCVASKRVIVVDELASDFLSKLTVAMGRLKAGDPFDPDTSLPPMSSQSAADRLKAQVKEATDNGATLTEVGEPVPGDGAFVQPAILTGVAGDNPVYDQEFFGPIIMFFRVSNEDEAVALANDSSYGLGGSVFTRDPDRGVAVAKRIDTGMVFINHPTWTSPELPFGGTKSSGYGTELAAAGIQEFVNRKLINVVPIDATP